MIQSLAEAVKTEVTLPIDWKPRPDQDNLWQYLANGGTRAVMVAHRRFGKDEVALHWAQCAAMDRVGNYWHMLPQYSQARKVVWKAINPRTSKRRIDECFPQWMRSKTNEQDMSIEFINGSIWQLVGSDNYDTLVGSPPVGITFSEWAIANPMSWAYLSPILEENGGWALFIYTSRGNNHGKTMYETARTTEGWFSQLLRADQTPVFNARQLEQIKSDLAKVFGPDLGQALFEQEYFCSFAAAVFGAYYAKQIAEARRDGRICNVRHDTGFEVHTFWDLGVDDSTTIWFMQHINSEYRFIDYYEASGYGWDHYAKVLKDKPYVYGNHYMPHDVEHRKMAQSNIAKSGREMAQDLGIKPVITVERVRNIEILVYEHIPAVRTVLAQCVFDDAKCSRGIQALENYRAEYDEERKVLGQRPEHDWTSHAADAFRTFAIGYQRDNGGLQPGYQPRRG